MPRSVNVWPMSLRAFTGIFSSSANVPFRTPRRYLRNPSITVSRSPITPTWQSLLRYTRCVIQSGKGSCGLALRTSLGEDFAAIDFNNGFNDATVGGSSPISGSSSNRTSGLVSSALAIRALLPWPFDRNATGRSKRGWSFKSVVILSRSSALIIDSSSGVGNGLSSVFPIR